jgi:hypothetical protein
MLKKMFEKLVNVAVLAGIAWAGWYGYTNWMAASSDTADSAQVPAFSCRQALAQHAEDQACTNSGSCSRTSDEIVAVRKREVDIEQYCN